MNEPFSLRDATKQFLADFENPHYVPPARVAPSPAAVVSQPVTKQPSKMSPEWRAHLDTFFAGLDTPLEEVSLETAETARAHAKKHIERAEALDRVYQGNALKGADLRDEYRNKEVVRTGTEAKAKLRSMAIQDRFCVPDEVARNMQALVSYHNQKPEGKRYKTERIDGPTSMLAVWRTR